MSSQTYFSTMGGTLLSVVPHINCGDLIRTTLLAVIGTVVSFTLSVVLRYLFKKFKL
jgi:hypothetical protein